MGSSEGPGPKNITNGVVNLTDTAKDAIQQLTEVNRASAIGIRGVNQATDGLKNVAVENALIASGVAPAGLGSSADGGSAVGGMQGIAHGQSGTIEIKSNTPEPVNVKLTQYKSLALHGGSVALVGLLNMAWLTNMGTELPDGAAEVIVAAIFQVAAGQGIPVAIANFFMKWKG